MTTTTTTADAAKWIDRYERVGDKDRERGREGEVETPTHAPCTHTRTQTCIHTQAHFPIRLCLRSCPSLAAKLAQLSRCVILNLLSRCVVAFIHEQSARTMRYRYKHYGIQLSVCECVCVHSLSVCGRGAEREAALPHFLNE